MPFQDKVDAIRNKIAAVRTKITGRNTSPMERRNVSSILTDFQSKAHERVMKIPILSERPLIQRATGNKLSGGDLITGSSAGVAPDTQNRIEETKDLYY